MLPTVLLSLRLFFLNLNIPLFDFHTRSSQSLLLVRQNRCNSAGGPAPAARQYVSSCCTTHAVRTISEAIHQRGDEPSPVPATCLLRLLPQSASSRQGLIGPINQRARLEEARLYFSEERTILEDIYILGNKECPASAQHACISTFEDMAGRISGARCPGQ